MGAEVPEKRTFQRYALWFPVTLVTKDVEPREIWAICRDASAGGIQVSSVAPLRIGSHVSARFRVAKEAHEDRVLEAEVVWSDANQGELMLAFPIRLGLRFSAALPELLEELAGHAGTVRTTF